MLIFLKIEVHSGVLVISHRVFQFVVITWIYSSDKCSWPRLFV